MMATLLTGLVLLMSDPRIRWVELQMQGQTQAALEAVEEFAQTNPKEASRLGAQYLRGHLLDQLDRPGDAAQAFAQAIVDTPRLEAHARWRLARDQLRLGHPEVAAGLGAMILNGNPPRSLIGPAADLLTTTLEAGGDCQLLGKLSTTRLPALQRRSLQLTRAQCALRSGDLDGSQQLLIAVLSEKSTDLPALRAAQTLVQQKLGDDVVSLELAELLGLAFHHHRQFESSAQYLGRVVLNLEPRLSTRADFETLYRFVRSQFWQGRFTTAAEQYAELADRATGIRHTAQALYHQGRSHELAGAWDAARLTFRRAHEVQPAGNFAGAALLGALRLSWRIGDEKQALADYQHLLARRQTRPELARAALFMAASDITLERPERAGDWLDVARSASSRTAVEVAYWKGRLAELESKPAEAVDHYVEAIRIDYFHPHSQLALARLRSTDLDKAIATRRARARDQNDSMTAWLLGSDDPRQSEQLRLEARAEIDARLGRPLMPAEPVAAAEWPLWRLPLSQPQEMLLALGIWAEGDDAVRRHFPVSQPELSLTAGHQLIRSGRPRQALLAGEILYKRLPKRTPDPLLPRFFREVLHPPAYRDLIDRFAAKYRVDANLLSGLIREESRFDARAASAASARGLAQFVYATAVTMGNKIGLEQLEARDLERPEISIELGAAYLRQLLAEFDGVAVRAIAAYNAGQPQAALWARYCYSEDPAEYLSKVAFNETRSYLARVLSSQAAYAELRSASATAAGSPRGDL